MEQTMEQKLADLDKRVNDFVSATPVAGVNMGSLFKQKSQALFDINNFMYLVLPVLCVGILYMWKPSFVMKEESIDGAFPTKVLSLKLVLIYGVGISVVLSVLIFAYLYKK